MVFPRERSKRGDKTFLRKRPLVSHSYHRSFLEEKSLAATI